MSEINVVGLKVRMTKEALARKPRKSPREGVIVEDLPGYWLMVKFNRYKHPKKVPGEQWELSD